MAYMGFDKLKGELEEKKGKGKGKKVKDAGGLAAWIGRKKYGKKKFQTAAAQAKSLKGE